ncbi:FAS1-like dehydratase domain-containing protein [Mycolicibacterium fortuitum]|uniref:FAS1-like dehydratase domain-containing protein n=1 Tax=Mycolicibacterium fortuitum TaxID=1766 RepID=UPI00148FFAB2|nr:MaoC family dehydratase [Mycolicibacterium fortuitum]
MSIIDPTVIGTRQPQRSFTVERGLLRMFARAIGETNPVYVDVEAARAAGYRDLPVPPTYFFGMNLGRGADEDMRWLQALGVDVRYILHGEQSFRYHSMTFAGDTLLLSPRISDVIVKKNGALQFIVRETAVTTEDGRPIADLVETIAVRQPEPINKASESDKSESNCDALTK